MAWFYAAEWPTFAPPLTVTIGLNEPGVIYFHQTMAEILEGAAAAI